jgi:hypothetical protein
MLYFFLLLAPPVAPACVLWIDHPPVPNDYLPPICPLDLMLPWGAYDLRAIGASGQTMCQWPAADHLTEVPCLLDPPGNYHIEVWLNQPTWACNVWLEKPTLTTEDIANQCPDWSDEWMAGTLVVRGPFEIHSPEIGAPACTLPQVDNTLPLATANEYQFLAGRLSWWGIAISPYEWQNRFDEQIRGAADTAGVPARLLKGMLANESQFWPLWTGTAGEVGWMQVTWDGADNALRHDPELFARYCMRAIWGDYCTRYDLLTFDQRYALQSALVADLMVSGTPLQVADNAADDLWIYAHILRAYACQASALYPERDVWQSAAVLYNAGTTCIQGDVICPQGQEYLKEVEK